MRLIRLGIAPAALLGFAATAVPAQDPPPPPAPPAPPPVYQPAPPAAPPVHTPPPAVQPAPVPAPMTPPPATPPAPPAPPAPPLAQAAPTPPAPPAPYRRCSAGRYASLGTCALRAVPGQIARLQVRIERNLPARPGAIILIWHEREDLAGVSYRVSGRALGASPGQSAGTILSVPVSSSYCAPNTRPFEAELELEGGRNLGLIGRFTFPCSG